MRYFKKWKMTQRDFIKSLWGKAATTTKFLDQHFTKHNWLIHPSVIPFIAYMTVAKNKNLHPNVKPVNHNVLNESKALKIAHTIMGKFCLDGDTKNAQLNEMGNDTCVLVGVNNKVQICASISFIHANNFTNNS